MSNPDSNANKTPESGGWENLGGDAEALKSAMRHFPSGVTVITSGSGENVEAMTANAVISVSLDPPLMLASVHRDARLNARIREEKLFVVSILSEEQEGHSRLFSSPERSSGLAAVHSLGDERNDGREDSSPPRVSGAIAAIECELQAAYPGGDHDLFLGRVVSVSLGDTRKNPLLYHEGSYPRLGAKPEDPEENRAFMDSPRGFDARLQGFQKRKKRSPGD